MTLCVDENVFRFQVPENDRQVVEVLEGRHDLAGEEEGCFAVELDLSVKHLKIIFKLK